MRQFDGFAAQQSGSRLSLPHPLHLDGVSRPVSDLLQPHAITLSSTHFESKLLLLSLVKPRGSNTTRNCEHLSNIRLSASQVCVIASRTAAKSDVLQAPYCESASSSNHLQTETDDANPSSSCIPTSQTVSAEATDCGCATNLRKWERFAPSPSGSSSGRCVCSVPSSERGSLCRTSRRSCQCLLTPRIL